MLFILQRRRRNAALAAIEGATMPRAAKKLVVVNVFANSADRSANECYIKRKVILIAESI